GLLPDLAWDGLVITRVEGELEGVLREVDRGEEVLRVVGLEFGLEGIFAGRDALEVGDPGAPGCRLVRLRFQTGDDGNSRVPEDRGRLAFLVDLDLQRGLPLEFVGDVGDLPVGDLHLLLRRARGGVVQLGEFPAERAEIDFVPPAVQRVERRDSTLVGWLLDLVFFGRRLLDRIPLVVGNVNPEGPFLLGAGVGDAAHRRGATAAANHALAAFGAEYLHDASLVSLTVGGRAWGSGAVAGGHENPTPGASDEPVADGVHLHVVRQGRV